MYVSAKTQQRPRHGPTATPLDTVCLPFRKAHVRGDPLYALVGTRVLGTGCRGAGHFFGACTARSRQLGGEVKLRAREHHCGGGTIAPPGGAGRRGAAGDACITVWPPFTFSVRAVMSVVG